MKKVQRTFLDHMDRHVPDRDLLLAAPATESVQEDGGRDAVRIAESVVPSIGRGQSHGATWARRASDPRPCAPRSLTETVRAQIDAITPSRR